MNILYYLVKNVIFNWFITLFLSNNNDTKLFILPETFVSFVKIVKNYCKNF